MSFCSTILTTTAVALLASASITSAGPWATPAGSQSTFDYSNGQNINGHWGDGVSLVNGFALFPSNFVANASNAALDSRSDTVSVILNAKPNHVFTSISASILGDYTILGAGGVDASGELRITNLDTFDTLSQVFSFVGLPALTATSAEDKWSGLGQINLPAGWKNVLVEADATLNAGAGPNSAAFIEGKVGNIGVETAVVPLPAAIFAAPAAIYIAYRARRKMTRK